MPRTTLSAAWRRGGGKRAGAPLEQGGPGRWALSRVQVMAEDAHPALAVWFRPLLHPGFHFISRHFPVSVFPVLNSEQVFKHWVWVCLELSNWGEDDPETTG